MVRTRRDGAPTGEEDLAGEEVSSGIVMIWGEAHKREEAWEKRQNGRGLM